MDDQYGYVAGPGRDNQIRYEKNVLAYCFMGLFLWINGANSAGKTFNCYETITG